MLRRTPLYEEHLSAGGKLGEFAGWELPLTYVGVRDEVRAVREEVGVFDVSHLAQVNVTGTAATAALNQLLTNEVSTIGAGRSIYSPMCNPEGGTLDDLICYRLGDERWLCLVNASQAEGDVAWMREHAPAGAQFELRWEALVAVQGPLSRALVSGVVDEHCAMLPRNGFLQTTYAGEPVLVACTGYTGEDGFEVVLSSAAAPQLWRALLAEGAQPCGLGARDVCRLEAALPLYGHELNLARSPLACGYAWAVKLSKPDFIGKAALEKQQREGVAEKLVGISLEGRAVPREGYAVLCDDESVGEVSSGTFSPTLERGIALAYVATSHADLGQQVCIDIRGRQHAGRVVALPFYRSDSM